MSFELFADEESVIARSRAFVEADGFESEVTREAFIEQARSRWDGSTAKNERALLHCGFIGEVKEGRRRTDSARRRSTYDQCYQYSGPHNATPRFSRLSVTSVPLRLAPHPWRGLFFDLESVIDWPLRSPRVHAHVSSLSGEELVGEREFVMNELISRRKLVGAGLAASIAVPATALTASNAEAQQNDQTPSAEPAPKKKSKKKKGTTSTGMTPQNKQPKPQ
jgi:hypothetical protein